MEKSIFYINNNWKNFVWITAFCSLFISSCKKDKDNDITNAQKISCASINTETVWVDRGDGIDYILECVLEVNAKLSIEPGVVIQCKNGSGIRVNSGGALRAVGTAAKKIELKGDIDAAGVWKGLYFLSNNVENELNYCVISNGGSSSFDGNASRKANIRVSNNAQLKLRNSTIAKSAFDGLYVDGLSMDANNPVTVCEANKFLNNQNYPISTIAPLAEKLDGTGTEFSGNSKNKVLLRAGRLYGAHTWKKLSVPYLIEGIVLVGYYSDNGNLTIQPGTVVEFAGDAGLATGEYSTGSWLKIVGTASEKIILTGETTQPGAWKGVAFQSLHPNNAISYADILYGGSSSYTGNPNIKRNIIAGSWSAGSFTIDNATVGHSKAWGIYVTLSSPNITVPPSVTYVNNASGNYYKE
jgi:hypothetical protein